MKRFKLRALWAPVAWLGASLLAGCLTFLGALLDGGKH